MSITTDYSNAAIIPVVNHQNERYYVLGLAMDKCEWVAFGGSLNRNENPVQIASQKCAAKSYEIWGNSATIMNFIQKEKCISNLESKHVTYFADIPSKYNQLEDLTQDFENKRQAKIKSKPRDYYAVNIEKIICISQETLQNVLLNPSPMLHKFPIQSDVLKSLRIAQQSGLIGSNPIVKVAPKPDFEYKNAAILPRVTDDKGNIHYLFSAAFGYGTLSTFGGLADAEDNKNPVTTAARECVEESLGIWGNQTTLEDIIKKEPKPIFNKNEKNITYIVDVPYIKEVAKFFEETREGETKSKEYSLKEEHCNLEIETIVTLSREVLLEALSKVVINEKSPKYMELAGHKIYKYVVHTLQIAKANNQL